MKQVEQEQAEQEILAESVHKLYMIGISQLYSLLSDIKDTHKRAMNKPETAYFGAFAQQLEDIEELASSIVSLSLDAQERLRNIGLEQLEKQQEALFNG